MRIALQTTVLSMMLTLSPISSWAAGNTIKLAADHITNLGVTLGKPLAVTHVPILYAPAKVVVPPAKEFIVSASQAGLVVNLNAAIGDKVKQGQLLATLNSSDLLSTQQLYLQANSDLELQQFAYQRDKKLVDEGVIAERRWLETRNVYNAAASAASEHRQLLAIAGMTNNEISQLVKSRHLSGLLSIRSPINGVVMDRLAVAGAKVDSLAPLYRIANLDELWLEINIPQERLGQIKLGDKVLLEQPATDSQQLEQRQTPVTMPISAEISLLGQNVNPENQTILARAVIHGEQSDVRPGQRINIQIIQPNSGVAFTVPNTAIAQQAGKSYIFVRNDEGFIAQEVTVIGKQGEEATISSALSGNEEIALTGAVALKANWLGLGSE
jgi:membrane fusion protein, heavy metal efflux system